MADYGTVIATIAGEVGRPDLIGGTIRHLARVIADYERERFWFNEGSAYADTVADQSNYELPSDFLELDSIKISYGGSTYPLTARPYEWIDATDSGVVTGVPEYFAVHADEFRLYPIPNGVYRVTIAYLKTLTALSTYTSTSAWTTEARNLIVPATKRALLESSPDQESQSLANIYREQERMEFDKLQQHTMKRRPSGGVLAYL